MTKAIAEVVHALPRRVHVRAPQLAGHRLACERIARTLARDPAHERVSVRERTGSIIVEREGGTLDPSAVAQRVATLVAAERDHLDRPLTTPPARVDGPTRLARAVAHAVAEINGDVRRSLEHEADLGTILPVAFAAGGLAGIVAKGKIPGPTWFNLVWWSLRSFMTFNVGAVDSEFCHANAARNSGNGVATENEGDHDDE